LDIYFPTLATMKPSRAWGTRGVGVVRAKNGRKQVRSAAPWNDNQKGNSNSNSKGNSKGSLVEVLLSHVSDDKAVASVGHPGGGGGAGEEREEAGSLGCALE